MLLYIIDNNLFVNVKQPLKIESTRDAKLRDNQFFRFQKRIKLERMTRQLHEQLKTIRGWKSAGNIIVFTNGCFDLLHPGHLSILEQARSLGDRLVVGLNTDSSVRNLKGDNRPIFNLNERTGMLNSLSFVDMVIPFHEERPQSLITLICPDVLAKGGDYTIDNIVGSNFVIKNGGIVKTLRFVKGYSTTEIINRIKEL